jgi:hypothetical protein
MAMNLPAHVRRPVRDGLLRLLIGVFLGLLERLEPCYEADRIADEEALRCPRRGHAADPTAVAKLVFAGLDPRRCR